MDAGFVAFDTLVRDGRAVHVRAVQPTDEAELVQAFHRMSADARYMRFMCAIREPNIDRLRAALATFPAGGIGLVATAPADDGIDIVGSAIAVIASDRTTCEFAITVSSQFNRTGLATTLMTALIAAAKGRGVAEMEGFVLAVNQPMLRLARRLGFSITSDPHDASVRMCRLKL